MIILTVGTHELTSKTASIVRIINQTVNPIGIIATRGEDLVALMWGAVSLMGITVLLISAITFNEWRRRRLLRQNHWAGKESRHEHSDHGSSFERSATYATSRPHYASNLQHVHEPNHGFEIDNIHIPRHVDQAASVHDQTDHVTRHCKDYRRLPSSGISCGGDKCEEAIGVEKPFQPS